jgi:hypothetical protein
MDCQQKLPVFCILKRVTEGIYEGLNHSEVYAQGGNRILHLPSKATTIARRLPTGRNIDGVVNEGCWGSLDLGGAYSVLYNITGLREGSILPRVARNSQ